VANDHLNALPAGYHLDDFTIESVLGAGGFGITYLAHERTLDRKVAIKEYLPRSAVRGEDRSSVHPISSSDKAEFDYGLTRFRDEAQTLVGFRHPNIVSVYRYFQANGTAYIVMEYVEGKSLEELLRVGDTLDESEAREILFPLLDGLEAVHKAGFLHRDIKPGNIFIESDGTPVLLDFGAARHAIGAHSKSLTGILTPGFAPFEQYATRGKQGPWTDIYALGATLYRAITGAKPPEATERIDQDNYVPMSMAAPPGFSPEFLHAIDEALEMRAAERPQSVAAWRAMFLEAPSRRAARPAPAAAPQASAAPPNTIVSGGEAADVAPTQAAMRVPDSAPTQAAVARGSPSGPPPDQPQRATRSGGSGRAALIIGILVVAVGALAGGGYWAWTAYEETERERIAAQQAQRAAELARQQAEEARRRAEEEVRRRNAMEAERKRAESEAKRRAESEAKRRAEEAKRRAEEAKRRAEETKRRAEEERGGSTGGTVERRNYPGGRYEGGFVNNRRHGFGKYWWDTGDRYEGRWVNGSRTGFGKYWWANGNRYVGNFSNNQLSGHGNFYWTNGNRYVGNFRNSQLNGHGTYYAKDGLRYVGNFLNGKFHGYGRIYWTSGARYFGQWSGGNRTDGTYWYPDGRKCQSRGTTCVTPAK